VKYCEAVSSWNVPPRKSAPIHSKICDEHANANPARSAPPGRRIPNVTAIAIQISPSSGGTDDLLIASGLNLVWLAGGIAGFLLFHASARERGMLLQLGE